MVLDVRRKNTRYHFLISPKAGWVQCSTSFWRGGIVIVMLVLVLSSVLYSSTSPARRKLIRQAKEAIAGADPFMGDWQGSWTLDDGTDSGRLVAQVIALGKGEYRASFFEEFDQRIEPIARLDGQLRAGQVHFSGPANYNGAELQAKAGIGQSKLTGSFKGQGSEGQDLAGTVVLESIVRLSPTLGAKPPAGAVVLFDGENFDQWQHAKKGSDKVQWSLVDGAMEVKPRSGSIITNRKFTDVKLHLEFRTPFMPEARGQGRGNSGVYLQGRYEVQILDSYGLEGRDNECGGIYKVAAPRVNMCAPPMQWQTYDITFRAPRFDSSGKKVKNAYLTVLHNGVTIHENVEVSPKPTTAAPDSNVTEPGGIYLQDHGNPVQFRNIWLVELPSERVSY